MEWRVERAGLRVQRSAGVGIGDKNGGSYISLNRIESSNSKDSNRHLCPPGITCLSRF